MKIAFLFVGDTLSLFGKMYADCKRSRFAIFRNLYGFVAKKYIFSRISYLQDGFCMVKLYRIVG